MSKLSNNLQCIVCEKKTHSIHEFTLHGATECIPNLLEYFGLPKATNIMELLEVQQKVAQLEEQINSLKVKLESAKTKKRRLSIGSSSSTFMDEDQSYHSQTSTTTTTSSTPTPIPKPALTSTSNSNAPAAFKIKEKNKQEQLDYRIEYGSDNIDIDNSEETNSCYLSQTLRLVSSHDKSIQLVFKCGIPSKGANRVMVVNGDAHMATVCKLSHFNDQQCSNCGQKCTTRIKAKSSCMPPVPGSYIHFCTYNCMVAYLSKTSAEVWKNKADELYKLIYPLDSKEKNSKEKEKEEKVKKCKEKEEEEEDDEEDDEDEVKDDKKETEQVKVTDHYLNTLSQADLKSLIGKMFITLVYLKHYVKSIITLIIFGISRRTAEEYYNEIIDLLYEMSLESFKHFASNEQRYERQSKFIDKYNNACLVTSVVDGSEQRDNFYSGKKGFSSITKLVFASPDGKIQNMAESRPGSRNDQGMMHEVDEFLKSFDDSWEYIMGDKGFQGSNHLY
ncbi:hypothetical protein PPL_04439 [Heterostelium album PN500]|uniref:DDE Tnp4 domain-containing protein n=1 Tax=Heterostelium pallidum (strain ATCC 26659 / Pp 5 / PN500) TaxID=670386 RepID=D3B7K1_HETP5|nr:hypothetical protein PPL_04439 [Heterostelium album PN500]EFA82744.1 hypothetical protein PPL_04439 [Heterostelium album PN500]|eukprot:XP_020434861.1 hypothetical protein PPL_04439 [Heterostelium album PN500]